MSSTAVTSRAPRKPPRRGRAGITEPASQSRGNPGEEPRLHREAGPECHGTDAFLPLSRGLSQDVFQDEEHGGAAHVAIVAEDVTGGDHLCFGEFKLRLDFVEDAAAAWMAGSSPSVPDGVCAQ